MTSNVQKDNGIAKSNKLTSGLGKSQDDGRWTQAKGIRLCRCDLGIANGAHGRKLKK